VGMTTNGWTPSANIIDVTVTIYIPNISPFYPFKNNGLATNGLKGSNRGTYSPRHEGLS